MKISSLVLMLSAGLMVQPAWARHHDEQRGPGRFPQQQFQRDPRQFQQLQRDPRQFQQQPQYQRPPQANFGPRNEPQFARPSNDFSQADAARRAQQMNGGGRILAVDPNGPGYRVKVLKEGEVRTIAVPGN